MFLMFMFDCYCSWIQMQFYSSLVLSDYIFIIKFNLDICHIHPEYTIITSKPFRGENYTELVLLFPSAQSINRIEKQPGETMDVLDFEGTFKSQSLER